MRAGRVKIENAYGQLKGRFQILRNLNMDLRFAAQTITACCVLHNFCGMQGEPLVESVEVYDNKEQAPAEVASETRLATEARKIRDVLFQDWTTRHVAVH